MSRDAPRRCASSSIRCSSQRDGAGGCRLSRGPGSTIWPLASADRLTIHIATRAGEPLAAVLTLQHKDVLVYKYGACDERFQRLGAMPFLLWKTILDAKGRGLRLLDLGRTDADNSGPATFNERLGATPSTLTYVRWADASLNISREEHLGQRFPMPTQLCLQ